MSAHRTALLPATGPLPVRRWLDRGAAPPLEVAFDPDADAVRTLAATAAPGSTVHILARAEGGAAAVRHVLASGLLLLRTERLDEGGLLVAAIRPIRRP